MEEENQKLGLQMKSHFARRVENIEDNLAVHTTVTEQFFLSVKDEIGKGQIFSQIIGHSWQMLRITENFTDWRINTFLIESHTVSQIDNIKESVHSMLKDLANGRLDLTEQLTKDIATTVNF